MAETEAAITAETEAIMEAVAMETRTEPIPELQMARPIPQISPQRMETMRPAETKNNKHNRNNRNNNESDQTDGEDVTEGTETDADTGSDDTTDVADSTETGADADGKRKHRRQHPGRQQ